jgi:hypothetical protein
MTLTAISDTVFSCARTINTTMQTVPYAGRAWVYARDNIVLPGAALAVALWSAGTARINYTADWVLPTIAVGVAAVGLLLVLAVYRRQRHRTFLLTPQQNIEELNQQLAAARAKFDEQEKVVKAAHEEYGKAAEKRMSVPANKAAFEAAQTRVDDESAKSFEYKKAVEALEAQIRKAQPKKL